MCVIKKYYIQNIFIKSYRNLVAKFSYCIFLISRQYLRMSIVSFHGIWENKRFINPICIYQWTFKQLHHTKIFKLWHIVFIACTVIVNSRHSSRKQVIIFWVDSRWSVERCPCCFIAKTSKHRYFHYMYICNASKAVY